MNTIRQKTKRMPNAGVWKPVAFAGIAAAAVFAALWVFLPVGGKTVTVEWTQGETADFSGEMLKGKTVIVDAGHGGDDPGTSGTRTARPEKEINLEIARRLRNDIEAEGAYVIMTRMTDDAIAATKDEDMLERERIIRDSGADLFISVHQNEFEEEDASGPQVFFVEQGSVGKRLAVCVQDALNERLEIENGRMALPVAYQLLKVGAQPSCTVECGFLSNPKEEMSLQVPEYQQEVADAITDGVKLYFATYESESEPV